ncbi:hypothetical protein GCM10009850_038030 [Nonomuraea monospora]|uniref:Secreted protein n=1 Tax=Nonomuraea monospora TaxID=568818 RepID=A0ABN3CGL5_9ACTN
MRKILAVLCTPALAGAVVAATPTAASATLTLVNCAGTTTVEFSPALTDTTQTVAVSGADEGGCVSLTHPGLNAFTAPFSGTATQSCTSFFAGGSGTETLYWNDSTTSAWNYTNSFSNVNGTKVGTSTGTIASGTLAGADVTQTITFVNLNLTACSTTGLSDISGTSAWTFSDL